MVGEDNIVKFTDFGGTIFLNPKKRYFYLRGYTKGFCQEHIIKKGKCSRVELLENDMYALYQTINFLVLKFKLNLCEDEEVKENEISLRKLLEDFKNFKEPSYMKS